METIFKISYLLNFLLNNYCYIIIGVSPHPCSIFVGLRIRGKKHPWMGIMKPYTMWVIVEYVDNLLVANIILLLTYLYIIEKQREWEVKSFQYGSKNVEWLLKNKRKRRSMQQLIVWKLKRHSMRNQKI